MVIEYGYEAYNLQMDRATGRAQLQTQVRLFHENQQVYSTWSATLPGQPGAKRLTHGGVCNLVRI